MIINKQKLLEYEELEPYIEWFDENVDKDIGYQALLDLLSKKDMPYFAQDLIDTFGRIDYTVKITDTDFEDIFCAGDLQIIGDIKTGKIYVAGSIFIDGHVVSNESISAGENIISTGGIEAKHWITAKERIIAEENIYCCVLKAKYISADWIKVTDYIQANELKIRDAIEVKSIKKLD